MSLNYDLTAIENRDTSDEGWGVTQALIFYTMSIGIGEITKKTLPEFWARLDLLNRLDGRRADASLTLEHVRANVGLKTNVFPMESRAAWLKRVVGQEMDRVARGAR